MKCKNCDQNIDTNFCPNCGQSAKVGEINLSYFLQEMTDSLFQINRGFFFTMRELFIRPGESIREYLSGKRRNHFKPVAYVLTLSTIYFIISRQLNLETFLGDLLVGFSNGATQQNADDRQIEVLNWFVSNYAYTMLMLLPMYALTTFLAFKRSGVNYLEHFILNAYIIGQQAIIYSISALVSLTGIKDDILVNITLLITVSFAIRVFWQFFSETGRISLILRSFLSYILSFIFMILLFSIILIGVM